MLLWVIFARCDFHKSRENTCKYCVRIEGGLSVVSLLQRSGFSGFIYHRKSRIKIVVFPVSWFQPSCLMSHVLVFLTFHGLGAPVGWILPPGAPLYGLRLDQIVRYPMSFQSGLCAFAIQFPATLSLSRAFLLQRSWTQKAKIIWGSCSPCSPLRIDSTAC